MTDYINECNFLIMKTKCIFIVLLMLVAVGCSDVIEIDYTLQNDTKYTVDVIDEGHVDKLEYSLLPFSSITIRHFNSAHFSLKQNNYPIEINNYFDKSIVSDIPKTKIKVKNNSGKELELIIDNNPIVDKFTITTDFEDEIELYTNFPNIKLIYDNNEYIYFSFKDHCLIIW